MSSYLFGLFLGPFVAKNIKSSSGIDISVYSLEKDSPHCDFALKNAPKMIEFFEKFYGIPYMLKKLDIIAVDKFEYGAMENWGILSFRKSMILVTPDTR